MKQFKQLSIFLCLIICFQFTSVKSTDFPDLQYSTFPEQLMTSTPDSGVFVDVNPNTFFYHKVNFAPHYYSVKKKGTNEVDKLSHNLVVDQPLA